MALDRQSIEKRDFPAARRGYSPDAVDAHLSAIADEVDELRRTTERGKGSIADTAGDQVRSILEAAQATAAQIRGEAEEEARRVRGEAHEHVKATRAGAAAEADEHVSQVSKSSAEMLERINQVDQELSSLLDVLRDAARRINAQLEELQAELHGVAEARQAPAPVADGAARAEGAAEEVEPRPPAEEPRPPAEEVEPRPPAVEPRPPAEEMRPEPAAEPPAATRASREPASTAAAAPRNSDEEGARLIALNMALNGSSRTEIDRYLSEHYDLADQGALLDEVFASVQG